MNPYSLTSTLILTTFLVPLVSSSIDDDFNQHEEVIQDIPNLLTSNASLSKSPGEDLKLFCQYNDYNEDIPVLWQYNSVQYSLGVTKLYNQREFHVEITQGLGGGVRLIVPNLSINDSGLYTCKLGAANSKSATFQIHVQDDVNSASVICSSFKFIPLFALIFSVFYWEKNWWKLTSFLTENYKKCNKNSMRHFAVIFKHYAISFRVRIDGHSVNSRTSTWGRL